MIRHLATLTLIAIAMLPPMAVTGCSDTPSRNRSDAPSDGAPSILQSDATIEPTSETAPEDPSDAAAAGTDSDVAVPDGNVAIEKTGRPLPAGVPLPRKLLGLGDDLGGTGRTGCTHQEPPSGNGDRWCAFTRPTGSKDVKELWVINVTAASTGEVPPCDGTSLACLRLTTSLNDTSANAFDGDTLIFYSDSITDAAGDLVGPISAWRPGWSQARQIAPSNGIFCHGHNQSAAASCLVKPAADPTSADKGQLLVGLLESESEGVLPALRSDDASPDPLLIVHDSGWQMGFSPDGETFALSTALTASGPSSMQVVATRDVATTAAHEIIADIQFWTVAAHGSKVYFSRNQGNSNTLNVASFPTGGGVTALASGLRSYLLLGSAAREGVGYLTDVGNDTSAFQVLTDSDAPSAALTIFRHQGSLAGVVVSPDLRYTVWLDDQFRGQLVSHDGLATCTLNSDDRRRVFLPMFPQSAGLVFWTESSQDSDSRRDAFLAPADHCREQQVFARGINFYTAVGDRGIILGDEHDAFDTVTLKYAPLSDGGQSWPPDGPVRVQERVKTPVTLVGTQPLLVVYRVVGDGQHEGGTYLFGPVPF